MRGCEPSHAAECSSSSSAVQPQQQRGAAVAAAACSSSRPEAAAEYAWSVRLQPTLQPSEALPWVWPQTEAAAWMEACNAPAGLHPPCSAAQNLQLLCHAHLHSTAAITPMLRRPPLPLFQAIQAPHSVKKKHMLGRDLLLNISRLSDPHLALAGWQRMAGGVHCPQVRPSSSSHCTLHALNFHFFNKHKSETNSSNLYYRVKFAFQQLRSSIKTDVETI